MNLIIVLLLIFSGISLRDYYEKELILYKYQLRGSYVKEKKIYITNYKFSI